MANQGPARRPAQPQPQIQSSGSGSSIGRVAIGALVASVLLVGVLAFVTRGGGEADTSTPKTDLVAELKKEGYRKVKEEKHKSAEADSEVKTEHWERSKAPERVVISDDSPYTTPGVLIVNSVTYTGADGQGNLTCQPDPEHARTDLKAIINDANAVRTGVNNGSIQPDPENNPDGFPYRGEFMLCKR